MGAKRWGRRAGAAALLAIAMVAGGCTGGGKSTSLSAGGNEESVSSGGGRSTEIAKGNDGPAQAGEVVATSASDWEQKWTAAGATGSAPAVGDVDFSDHVVIGLFAGEQTTGGWKIDPDVVVKTQGMFSSVAYKVVGPGKGCTASQDTSAPFLVLAISGERVRFERSETTKDC